jgi:IclR family transcriptional regulator, KDG regulon repressor
VEQCCGLSDLPRSIGSLCLELSDRNMKSLNKALDVLELIAENGKIGIRELAQVSGLPPATAHRIVAALVNRGYLNKDDRTHHYALSPKFLSLGEKVQQQIDIVSIGRPYLEALMAETRENANLCIRDGRHVIYIDHVGSPDHNLRIFTKLGGKAPLYASGVGKVFLSWFSESQFQRYLEAVELRSFTPGTLTTAQQLRNEIQTIREKGYAVDNQEKELGVRCVAAPIFNHRNQIEAALSVSGAAQRITMKRLPILAKQVVDVARQLSAAIGQKRS